MITRPTSQGVWGSAKNKFLVCLNQASVIGWWGQVIAFTFCFRCSLSRAISQAAGLTATVELELFANILNHYLIIVLSNLDFGVS